ncbi:competence type IV pilus minor pilin ComGD [Psychrobacillus sp. MER TA 171]|uniref:competence type IV pilus minor pilin ComGD n=1 Tax=Psychrobacillus sp. MER TA 171 TaxID=2939577 RepID=UPI00204025D1|nr:competence type IV pilus minor pilin ComGD [Psychrobacillus sp. MER TA 171]MCM3358353.1 type II secretion system GspH family protein [Psychrobacillus sp. MER TA 171]
MEEIKKQAGFTLIETTLMLMIVMVISSAVIYGTSNKVIELEEKRFFRQFQLDVQRAQALALSQEQYIVLKFGNKGTSYSTTNSNITLFENRLPSHISLSEDSKLKEVIFLPSGMVRNFGSFAFLTSKETKLVTVHIGTGKLAYEQ